MNGKPSKSKLFGNNFNTANERHKNDETTYQGADLPPGISGGIAKLVDAKIGVFKEGSNKGKPFLYLAGVVVSPKTHNGIKIAGRRTSIMEPLCDTPGKTRATFDDHLAYAYNELRKLEADTSEIESEEDLENILKELVDEDAPYFSFSTRQSKPTKVYPNPKTFHSWEGVAEYSPDGEDENDLVEDNSGDGDEEDEEEEEVKKKSGKDKDDDDSGDESDDGDDGDDEEEGESGGGEDDDEDSDGEEEGDGEENSEINAGDVVSYKPPKSKKPIECEVVVVDERKKTCKLESVDDGKVYSDVPLSQVTISS